MEGPSEGQSGPASAALHTAPRDREGGPNSGCAASSPHQAGATAASDASPGISLQTVRPQKKGEADSAGGPQNAAPHPALDSAPLSSGSESPAAAADLEPPFGASSGGLGSAAPPTSQEGEGGEDDIQDPPEYPPPPPPKSKSRKKFSMQSIVQSIRGILKLEGGDDFPRPLTRHTNQQLFLTLPKSNSSRGSGDRPNSWIPLKPLSRGSTLPKTAGLEVPAESFVCDAGSQAYHRSQGKHLHDPDSSAEFGPRAVGGAPVSRSEQGVPPGHPLAAFLWFHGNLSRLRAAQLVQSEGVRDHGLFLVRHSQTRRGHYVLTLNCFGKVKHVLVRLDEGGKCWVRDLLFPSIFDMLDYFRVHPIPFKSPVSCSATLLACVEDLERFSGEGRQAPPSPLGSREWYQCQAQVADHDYYGLVGSNVGSPRSCRHFQMPYQEFPGELRGRGVTQTTSAAPPSPPGSREWYQCQAGVASHDYYSIVGSDMGSPLSRHFQMPCQEFPGALRGQEVTRAASEDARGVCGGGPPDATQTTYVQMIPRGASAAP